MFQLYDSTRRRICMASFLAFGLLPTALVAVWCVNRHLPGHAQAEADMLALQLGLDVRILAFEHPRPGVVRYHGIEFSDRETGNCLLQCDQLEVRTQSGNGGANARPVFILQAVHPKINAAGLPCLGQTLQRIAEGRHGQLDADVQLTADTLAVIKDADAGLCSFCNVRATLATLADGVRAHMELDLNGGSNSAPVKIDAVRKRDKDSPPVSGWAIESKEDELPCELLALALGKPNSLGPESRFSGYLGAYGDPDGWRGELAGRFSRVDLDRLVTDHFAPHRLSGLGDLTIQSARFQAGRFSEIVGMVSAGPGLVDRPLLQAAVEQWGLTPPTETVHVPEMVPYQQLVFSLTINGEGVGMEGLCSIGGRGTVLATQHGRLLGEPKSQPRPLAAIIQTLVPPSECHVPVNPQTDWLMRYLPIPQTSVAKRQTPPPATEVRRVDTTRKSGL
jgi:hypothetical protein